MRQLSSAGQQLINDIAARHGFSVDATLSMLESVINGNGTMAQFSHPEFSGSGQWMQGGMTMVSDMFNNHLKGRVDALCSELAKLIASQPDLLRSGSFQSQSQGSGNAQSQGYGQQQSSATGQSGGQSDAPNNSQNSSSAHGGNGFGPASLFVPPAPGSSGDWWPADLRWPNSTGAQNNVRYAYFSQARRLVIDVNGTVTVYDTLDHQIGGFSQQQSFGGTLSFSSQYGLIDVASLPVISSNGAPPASAALRFEAPPMPAQNSSVPAVPSFGIASATTSVSGTMRDGDVFATLERLADLRAKGVISDADFAAKKSELLSRV